MISITHTLEYCSEDISKIENYQQAIQDTSHIWHCHHIRGLDEDLKAINEYKNRPAAELIFLPAGEHHKLHNTGEHNVLYGKHMSEETKQKLSVSIKKALEDQQIRAKMSEAKRGKPSPRKGAKLSEETKQKLREANLGKKHSCETRMKMSLSAKGKNTWAKGRHWYNNGIVTVGAYECPEGFVPGRLKKEA